MFCVWVLGFSCIVISIAYICVIHLSQMARVWSSHLSASLNKHFPPFMYMTVGTLCASPLYVISKNLFLQFFLGITLTQLTGILHDLCAQRNLFRPFLSPSSGSWYRLHKREGVWSIFCSEVCQVYPMFRCSQHSSSSFSVVRDSVSDTIGIIDTHYSASQRSAVAPRDFVLVPCSV
jgi:hypothetical protein